MTGCLRILFMIAALTFCTCHGFYSITQIETTDKEANFLESPRLSASYEFDGTTSKRFTFVISQDSDNNYVKLNFDTYDEVIINKITPSEGLKEVALRFDGSSKTSIEIYYPQFCPLGFVTLNLTVRYQALEERGNWVLTAINSDASS